MPSGIAIKDNQLYIAAVDTIYQTGPLDQVFAKRLTPRPVFAELPKDKHHGWKFIDFGPDGLLYIPVGAPCNVCLSDNPVYASIQTLDLSVKPNALKAFAHGVRNSVGFSWHPETQALWFTDNGRDHLGDHSPPCELNIASTRGLHFGYPYCHQGDLPDPEFGDAAPCSDFTPPAAKLGPHVAPLGLEFYTGKQFPKAHQGQVFVAEHGSWNRSEKIGYRVMMATLDGNEVVSYKPFAEGWLDDGDVWGRPVDIELLPDGSMLVSDDFADAIYRIYYNPKS